MQSPGALPAETHNSFGSLNCNATVYLPYYVPHVPRRQQPVQNCLRDLSLAVPTCLAVGGHGGLLEVVLEGAWSS